MAGDAVVGALRVVLGMDTATFEDGTKKAAKNLESFGASAAKIGAGIAAGLAVAAAGLAVAMKNVIDEADKLGKTAQKFGVPVEQLSSLAHAAELSDISLEQLGSGLGKLSKNMILAQKGTGDQAAAFAALNISILDSNKQLKSSDQVLLEVADRFSKFEDGVTKTALAMAIFGKSGAELIPLLNQGATGIQALRDQAQKLGIVIDGETAKAAEQFNDNLKTLGKTKDAIILKILGSGGLLQAMAQLSARMVDTATNSSGLQRVGDALGKTLQVLTVYIDALVFSFSALALPFRAIVGAFAKAAVGDFAGAWALLRDRVGATKGAFDQMVLSARNLATGFVDTDNAIDNVIETMAKLDAARVKLKPPPIFDPEARKQLEKYNEDLKRITAQTLEAAGVFGGQLAPGFLSAAEGMKILDGQVINVRDRMIVLGPLADQLNQKMLALRGAQLTAEVIAPLTEYENKLIALNALMAQHAQLADLARLAALKAAVDMATAYGMAAQAITGPLASAFKDMASMNKKYAGIAKTAAIAEAIVQTFLGATKAFTANVQFGLPFAFAAAAAATAAGLANVAKISATQFATGGSFKVGGGMGGVDSQLISMALTPGEMVDVRRPGQERSTVTEITVNMRGRDIFNGDAVRDLFDAINQGTADGYRLRVAG